MVTRLLVSNFVISIVRVCIQLLFLCFCHQSLIFSAENPDNLLCGCIKSAAQFTTQWLDKVVADTGDKYLFPTECTGWIDPDGHCHEDSDSKLRAKRVQMSTPKLQVRGVVG